MASYSDAELQEIARWLKDGLSASKIAAAFSALRGVRVSRNAIIGIVHRNAMLGAIGFANGRGVPPGQAGCGRTSRKRARKVASRPRQAAPNSQGGHGAVERCLPPATPACARPLPDRGVNRRRPGCRRACSCAMGVLIADGEAYRLEVPVPQRAPLGRQPHGVAMRFIDCLFGRCRAPLDLTLEEDPENDAPRRSAWRRHAVLRHAHQGAEKLLHLPPGALPPPRFWR